MPVLEGLFGFDGDPSPFEGDDDDDEEVVVPAEDCVAPPSETFLGTDPPAAAVFEPFFGDTVTTEFRTLFATSRSTNWTKPKPRECPL